MKIGQDFSSKQILGRVHLLRIFKCKNIKTISILKAINIWNIKRRTINKLQKNKNGNNKIKTRKLSFLHWNKASSHFKTNKELILL